MTDHVVLIPGMMCSEQLWADVEDPIRRHARIHHAVLERNSIASIAHNILASAPPNFTAIGLSLGGIVAMHLAVIAPHRITGVALLSTNARAPRPGQLHDWREAAARLDRGGSAVSEQRRLLPDLVSKNSRTADPTLNARVLAMAEHIGREGLRAQLAAQASRIDYLDALREITCPSLVLAGEDDTLCAAPAMREIAAHLPDSTFQIIPGGGHLTPMERPTDVGRTLSAWLASIDRPGNAEPAGTPLPRALAPATP
ncbi:alpha/beta fold hydrolase [Rhodococcus opacus]|uniref:Putative hydrolase n=1 Tax=Rhodococcus opacus (strain B4) TaxID=632772 RepID=C1B697_RHOOB|nr:alpha/beta hydrolase [Rhodococcus opacus]BAH51200.1 putative hydrolase [Rhodococcus opacus B4]